MKNLISQPKRAMLAIFGLLLTFPCMSQTNLFFSDAFKSQKKYVFETKDVIYFSTNRSGGTNNLCNNRDYRIRDHEVIIQLVSTSASAIKIHASSTGSKGRTIKSVEVSNSRKGGYAPIKYETTSTVGALNKGCGTLDIKGINIEKGSFVKINFEENTNISEFEIQP